MVIWKRTLIPIVAALPVLMQCKSAPQQRTVLGSLKAANTASFIYVADAFDDSSYNKTGVAGQGVVGGTPFEIYGIAYLQQDDYLYFAVNANMGTEGIIMDQNDLVQPSFSGPYKDQRHIGFGDLIFNFAADQTHFPADQSATTALWGIHFADGNETKLTDLGLYQAVKTTTYVTVKDGFPTLNDYYNRIKDAGNTPVNGQLSVDDPYFDANQPIATSMDTGTRVTGDDFAPLSDQDLAGLGLDFPAGLKTAASALGSTTFGFKFKVPTQMRGAFTAQLTPECGNDIIAFRGTLSHPSSGKKILAIKKLWSNGGKSLDSNPPQTVDIKSFAITATTTAQTIRCSYPALDAALSCVQLEANNVTEPVDGLDVTDVSNYTVKEEGLPAGYAAISGIGSFKVSDADNCVEDTTKGVTFCEHKVTNALHGGNCSDGGKCNCGKDNSSCVGPKPSPCTGKDCMVPPSPSQSGGGGCCGFIKDMLDRICAIFRSNCTPHGPSDDCKEKTGCKPPVPPDKNHGPQQNNVHQNGVEQNNVKQN